MSERVSQPVLSCEGVSKRFGDLLVLRDISLELRAGEVLGLIGAGGQGKSVLLKLLAGLLEPSSGCVRIGGDDLAAMSAEGLEAARRDMGYLFQNYALFDFMTVHDNVAFPLRQHGALSEELISRKVTERLAEVGLAHAVTLYPNELSGGMKKRVGMARATITDPSLTLYDDPSAGLDPVTSSKIFALIARMQAQVDGAAAVVVSHDIDRMKAICTRYIMLHEGEICFDGPESALAEAAELPREFFYGAASKHEGQLA